MVPLLATEDSLEFFLKIPEGDRDKNWIRRALQAAVQLEFYTIPTYLISMWSICGESDPTRPVRAAIESVVLQEMLHFGLVCNLLTCLGETPCIDDPHVIPIYPHRLPWHIHPHLTVGLERLSLELVQNVFMEIEKPECSPIIWHRGRGYKTIGAFYSAIFAALQNVPANEFTGDRQLTSQRKVILDPITSKPEALAAIILIKEQGEGTEASPLWGPSKSNVAHYFRFGEILHQKRLEEVNGVWSYSGSDLPFPANIHCMAPIPVQGYVKESLQFNRRYTDMLHKMQEAWQFGKQASLNIALAAMRDEMEPLATKLMTTRIQPDRPETYGPSFQFVI